MHVGACHLVGSDKFVFHIYRNMILVTKETFVILFGPAGICVFLPLLVLTPPFLLAVLDLLVFVASITLYRNLNNACINDLTLLGLETLLSEKVVEGRK